MSTFLTKFQEKYPSKYGEEGYGTILREIYRNGNLSLRLLSFITHIPVTDLQQMVNNLTEKEILGRVPDGILFTQKGMQYIEEELGFYGYGIQECELCEGTGVHISERWDYLLERADQIIEELGIEITPENLVVRILHLYEIGALEGKKVCFLDGTSLLAAMAIFLYEGIFPEEPQVISREMVVVEDNQRIRDVIENLMDYESKKLFFKEWSIIEQVPMDLHDRFDSVIVYPHNIPETMELSLSRAITLLKNGPGKNIYSFVDCPCNTTLFTLEKLFLEMGLLIKSIDQNLNMYYHLDPSFIMNSQILVQLATTNDTTPKIRADEEKIYMESAMERKEIKLRIFWCEECQKSILIGDLEDSNYKDLEKLAQEGCPYCGSKDEFHPDESEETSFDFDKYLEGFKEEDE